MSRKLVVRVTMSRDPRPLRYHEERTEGADTSWSSSPERYSGCTGRGRRGVGWGGGGSSAIVKNSRASPISPSTPMFAVCVGRAAEKDSAGDTSPALSGDGEALVVGSSYSSWEVPTDQAGSQDIEGE